MGLVITFAAIVTAFFVGARWNQYSSHKKALTSGCPFKNACTRYDEQETRAAVKRVLHLLVDSNVSNSEIKTLVDDSLK